MNPNADQMRTDKLKVMINRWLTTRKEQLAAALQQGISPRRLALTLALGFAIGCLPVIGIPTALCAMLALTLRLNLPAIQAANYAAMPLQMLLILPFVRLGGWLFAPGQQQTLSAGSMLHGSASHMLFSSGSLAGQALLAWLVIAGPAVVLMTLALTPVLQRVPVLAAESGD
jgi:uncharacterized protein (DUF2062 family)